MRVSVVICTYSPAMFGHLLDAVESVFEQTHDDVQVVVVVDGAPAIYERLLAEYDESDDFVVHLNRENRGLSASRNAALEYVTGDVVAFMDDDAIADERWLEALVSVYRTSDAIAVGGRMEPAWQADAPSHLPEEFYWLVGVTHRGFAEPGEEVRNTFGSNISFRHEILRELGGFEPDIGRRGDRILQAEEPELCSRMRLRFGRGVVYTPEAIVYHKVFEWRTGRVWLAKRAFWQGYSKRVMKSMLPDLPRDEEAEFLTSLLTRFLPRRLRRLVTHPSIGALTPVAALVAFTSLVGLGYLYGSVRLLVQRSKRNGAD